jgi:hypothetical protein
VSDHEEPLMTVELHGGPTQAMASDELAISGPPGVLGVDVAARTIDGQHWTVVQLLLDDDHPLFDRALLDAPTVAEVCAQGPGHGAEAGSLTLAREPFDHHEFRRQLLAEREAGEQTTRGVLVLTGGQLPPPYLRLAFLPVELAATAAATLTVRRTTVAELVHGVEAAHARGDIGDDDRRALLIGIEQHHPTPSA